MKGQNKIKLAIINVLSNPDVKLTNINIENDIGEEFTDGHSIWVAHTTTGTSKYIITVYNPKNDRRIPTKD